MKKQSFDLIDDSLLGAACFEPFVQLIRGKDIGVKTKVYETLTQGQKAMFMFFAHYNHAKHSQAEFYWWSAYYYAQPRSWEQLKKGLQSIQAEALLVFFAEMEEGFVGKKIARSLDAFNVTTMDVVRDPQLGAWVKPFYEKYEKIAPTVLQQLGKYIRENPHEFIQFEGI